jgi:hypothetical protein
MNGISKLQIQKKQIQNSKKCCCEAVIPTKRIVFMTMRAEESRDVNVRLKFGEHSKEHLAPDHGDLSLWSR